MKWLKSIWLGSFLGLLFIVGLTILLVGKEAIPEALVAWGTIVLAYTTYMLVRENRDQEERNRKALQDIYEQSKKDAMERENRYRQETQDSETRYRKAEVEKEERNRLEQKRREDSERKERILNELREWINRLEIMIRESVTESLFNAGTPVDICTDKNHPFILLRQCENLQIKLADLEYFLITASVCSPVLGNEASGLYVLLEGLNGYCKHLSDLLLTSPLPGDSSEKFKQHFEKTQTLDNNILKTRNEIFTKINIVNQEIAKAKISLLKE